MEEKQKKILVLAHLYVPDVASTACLYEQLCECLAKQYKVSVICTTPCYAKENIGKENNSYLLHECINNVQVDRVKVPFYNRKSKFSRIKHLLVYFFKSIRLICLKGRFDYVLALAQPPLVGGLLGVFAKFKTKGRLIYNIQDLNPEQIEYTSYSSNKLVINLIRSLDNYVCRKSNSVIVVSPDMKDTLETRLNDKSVPSIEVISNWADTKEVVPIDKSDNYLFDLWNLDKSKFYIGYAGNFGLLQNMYTILRCAEYLLDNKDIVFVFIGAGAEEEKMRQFVLDKHLNNVVFKNYLPASELKYVYSLGDVGLVSIGKNITKCSMPSKTWNILACGRPVICQVQNNSYLWNFINDNHLGFTVDINDYESMGKYINLLYENSVLRKEFSYNSRCIAINQFDVKVSTDKYIEVIENNE